MPYLPVLAGNRGTKGDLESHRALLSGDRQGTSDPDRFRDGDSRGAAPSVSKYVPSGAAQVKPVIGIDLGTTNCALAFTRDERVEQFAIPQLIHAGEVREETLLPSFVFLDPAGPIAGVLAQKMGVEY